MSDFKDGIKKIVDAVKDMAELNVQTYTGTIKAELRGKPLAAIMADSVADGTLETVALTTIRPDGDVDQFISNSESVTEELRKSHFSAVDAGLASRKAVLEFFAKQVERVVGVLID